MPDLKSALRQRHHLKDDADVRIMATKLLMTPEAVDTHRFTARITTDALDRQDEVVIPDGGMFGEFLASGAIFWNHQYDQPVGYPDKAKKILKGENFVEAGGVFMTRPEGWVGEFFPDFVREFVAQGVAAGICPGVSIGFIPIETRNPSKLDRQKYGDRVQAVHSKWKLLEFSIAPVQANQEAVVTAVGKGLMRRELAIKCGFTLPPVAAPVRKVVKAVLGLPSREPVDMAAIVARETRRQVLKAYGRVFMPS